ncbi:MAG: translation initiation factor IF-2, partial [Bacteroidaceae bacterium]|nr:translation initiation factor IF-2 [Bacteroidaceae bacterium]
MRLNKAIKEFNVGLQTAVDALKNAGHEIEANLNTKIDDAQYAILEQAFGADKEQRAEADKLFHHRREDKRNEREEAKAEAEAQKAQAEAEARMKAEAEAQAKAEAEAKAAAEKAQAEAQKAAEQQAAAEAA